MRKAPTLRTEEAIGDIGTVISVVVDQVNEAAVVVIDRPADGAAMSNGAGAKARN